MTRHYYNEWNPYAAQWLRNLIAAGEIPPGVVDTRSITHVRPQDLDGFIACHFFAGVGGWPLALRLAGWPPERPVWTGSCPCQPYSVMGLRAGARDPRNLWPTFRRLIRHHRPSTVLGEQVASADGRAWLAALRGDLEAVGYAVGAADLCAAGVGAPHIRQRLFWLAHAHGGQREGLPSGEGGERHGQAPGWHQGDGLPGGGGAAGDPWAAASWLPFSDGKQRPVEPGTFPVAARIPATMERLSAYGNSISPHLAAEFIRAALEAEVVL